MKRSIIAAVLAASLAAGCSMFRWSGSPPPTPAPGGAPEAPSPHPAPLPADVDRSSTTIPSLKP